MAINLSRNTKVYVSTVDTGFNNNNTFEIQVMSDYSFTQNTEQQTITLNESGAAPSRGQRSFNTALSPAEWRFGMYIRPYAVVGATSTIASGTASAGTATITTSGAHGLRPGDLIDISGTGNTAYDNAVPIFVNTAPSTTSFTITTTATVGPTAGTVVRSAATSAAEKLFWNALASNGNVFTGVNAGWTESATAAVANFANSNAHQLAPLNLIFKTDSVAYLVKNCSINQAEVSFAIDQIAMINWSGNGTEVINVSPTAVANITPVGTYLQTVDAAFITNKLSTISIEDPINTVTYNIPITGGTLTINNNIQYLTPEILGIVNKPITYFTSTRAISGTLNAYLRTGGGTDAEGLYNALLAAGVNSPDNLFYITVNLGGVTGARVVLEMPYTMLQIPTIDVQDVISTTINFTAQGGTGSDTSSEFDISAANELTATYHRT